MTDYIVKEHKTSKKDSNVIVAKFSAPYDLAVLLIHTHNNYDVFYNRKPIFTHVETDDPTWRNALVMSDPKWIMTDWIMRYDHIAPEYITDSMIVRKLADLLDRKSGANFYCR